MGQDQSIVSVSASHGAILALLSGATASKVFPQTSCKFVIVSHMQGSRNSMSPLPPSQFAVASPQTDAQTSWFKQASQRSGVASCTVQSVAGSPSSLAQGATG